MAKSSRVLRCRVIALPLLWLQLLPLLPLCALREVTCPTPKSVENADIKVKSHSIESRERYVCNSGFKRQAGTSNLIQCILDHKSNTARWTETNLKCIRDPSLVHLQTSSSTMSTRKLPTPIAKGFTVEPEASKSSTTVTTETIMMSTSVSLPSSIHTESPALAGTVSKPVSKEISSEPPSATVIITTRNWSFTILAQTTAQTMEQSSPTTYGIKPDKQYYVIPYVSVTIAIILILIAPYFIYWLYTRRRDPVPEVSVGIEEIPMTGGTDREEDVDS
ncbi:interleukin-15 receptor subunit alpha [Sarcophilus harrisii]|uniref:Interleukin-15 receptor subunit alpha n=1 Tax=Sarcophilus harrisii TaxID=9305 RepID=G3WAF4_SARHA|nr:interleukin-15 receptor subunit alpha [Sarcophilus harrisii]